MIYEYVCTKCGMVHESSTFAHIGDPLVSDEYPDDEDPSMVMIDYAECCRGAMVVRRVSMPQVQGSGVHNPYPYFNHNVNAVIESDKHYQQVLKGKAELNENLTGTDHRYVPVYPGDLKDEGTMKKLGVGQGADRGESIENSRRLNWRATPKSKSKFIDMGAK